ncbi:MAG: hypothetical protein ACJ76Z_00105 [Thermoleophilaceae bacterium]
MGCAGRTRTSWAVAGLVGLGLLATVPAQAARLSITTYTAFTFDGGGITYHDLQYTAGPRELNQVKVSETSDRSTVFFSDPRKKITVRADSRFVAPSDGRAQWGCLGLGQPRAVCSYLPATVDQCSIFTCDNEAGSAPGFGSVAIDTADGNDSVEAHDGRVESISCGDGVDSVTVDPRDVVAADCETVTIAH